MKQTSIHFKFNEEKLNAVKQYMGKKDAALDKELAEVMQKLYERHVPVPVREYIESREPEEQDKIKKSTRPSSSATKNGGDNQT